METETTREARLSRVDPAEADPSLKDSFDAFVRNRGHVPNLFRIMGQRPPIGRTLAEHISAVTGRGEVSMLLKEFLSVRVSQANNCEYCLASHTTIAKRLGGTEEQVAALARGDLDGFEATWRAPLEAAVEMTKNAGRIAPETFARMAADWTEPQIVEMIAVIGLFNYFNRIANALEIPPTV